MLHHPRCFVGFYGITRSLRHTAWSIHECVYEPLRRAGIPVLRVGHFNLPAAIVNPRSGEFGLVPDAMESDLLDLDLCWTEPQDDANIARELRHARAYPDSYQDDHRSISNLCHQLRSLNRLWSLMTTLGVADGDLVLLLRPDLLYLDALVPGEHLSPLSDGRADLIVPGWQSWGGMNDRFAFCTKRGAQIYATRLRTLIESSSAMGYIHSERFLDFVVRRAGLRVGTMNLRAMRVRANGSVAGNDVALLPGSASLEKSAA